MYELCTTKQEFDHWLDGHDIMEIENKKARQRFMVQNGDAQYQRWMASTSQERLWKKQEPERQREAEEREKREEERLTEEIEKQERENKRIRAEVKMMVSAAAALRHEVAEGKKIEEAPASAVQPTASRDTQTSSPRQPVCVTLRRPGETTGTVMYDSTSTKSSPLYGDRSTASSPSQGLSSSPPTSPDLIISSSTFKCNDEPTAPPPDQTRFFVQLADTLSKVTARAPGANLFKSMETRNPQMGNEIPSNFDPFKARIRTRSRWHELFKAENFQKTSAFRGRASAGRPISWGVNPEDVPRKVHSDPVPGTIGELVQDSTPLRREDINTSLTTPIARPSSAEISIWNRLGQATRTMAREPVTKPQQASSSSSSDPAQLTPPTTISSSSSSPNQLTPESSTSPKSTLSSSSSSSPPHHSTAPPNIWPSIPYLDRTTALEKLIPNGYTMRLPQRSLTQEETRHLREGVMWVKGIGGVFPILRKGEGTRLEMGFVTEGGEIVEVRREGDEVAELDGRNVGDWDGKLEEGDEGYECDFEGEEENEEDSWYFEEGEYV